VLNYSFDLLAMSMSSCVTLLIIFSRLGYTMVWSSEPNALVLLQPLVAYRFVPASAEGNAATV